MVERKFIWLLKVPLLGQAIIWFVEFVEKIKKIDLDETANELRNEKYY